MKAILERLMKGDASCLTQEVIFNINQIVLDLINKEPLTNIEIDTINDILHISNIIYNNTDRSILVLEDGIYDLLLEKYKKYNPNFQVGAEPINISNFNNDAQPIEQEESSGLFMKIPYVDTSKMMFGTDLNRQDYYGHAMFANVNDSSISKRIKNTAHKYPKLVGTLHKAKFTLDQEAQMKGVYENNNVRIFERDFLRKHVQNGLVDPNNITLVLELKYDGVSVEAEVTDRILSARTRGDTQMDKASDITPILKGYQFTRASGYNITPFGMKFEAVISYRDLIELSKECGKNYVNPRNAIIGILGNSEAARFAKYITLVPLATSHDNMNRIEELEFMNKYYSTGEFCRYTVVSGNYNTVLYQVKQFVDEAEKMRDYLPFMYDGVVVSYLDEGIRSILGRKNSINEYSIAIKFNTKKKLTRCRSISYTVGCNGDITPMINYDPVEFYGMINTKSSGHSYGRFMELGLKPDDILEIEYVNDVIAYVKKADVEENKFNPRPKFQFITNCPVCGTQLQISESFKNAKCPNMECEARYIGRVTNMMSKLGFKGFSEAAVSALKLKSFYDLMTITKERADILGPTNSDNLIKAVEIMHETPVPDYILVGSLGFTGISIGKWKSILKEVSLDRIVTDTNIELISDFKSAKGIGKETTSTIINERGFYIKDLAYILKMNNVIFSHKLLNNDVSLYKVIRFTGVRDKELEMKLLSMGHDCGDGSVTKNTDILIIPYEGFTSSKIDKANKYNASGSNIKIITLDEFRLNESSYLNDI